MSRGKRIYSPATAKLFAVSLFLVVVAPVIGIGSAFAQTIFSDDFASSTLNSQWQVMPGQGNYAVGGGRLRYFNAGPTASTTGWDNPALTLAFPFTGTNWQVEVKATYSLQWCPPGQSYTGPPTPTPSCTSGAQGPEVLVKFNPSVAGNDYAGSDYAVIERVIDAYYGSDSLSASYGEVNNNVVNPVDSQIINNVAAGTYWYRIIRNGGTLTIQYSSDGSVYITAFSTSLSDPSSSYNELLLGGITFSTAGSYTDYSYVHITGVAGPPVASFAWSPNSPGANQAVQFTDTSTNLPTSWLWNFGDDGTSTLENPSHSYTSPGTYLVSLMATNESGSNTTTVPITVGSFGTATTITTNPSGLQMIVDGSTLTSPQSFSWAAGSIHTIGVVSPQTSPASRSTFTAWSDGGPQTHTITVGRTSFYIADFATQYLLTTSVVPATAGSIAALPSSADGFYDAGTTVQLTASPSGSFQTWTGDLSGSVNPQSIVMNAPRSVAANFGTVTTITTNPPGLQIAVDGTLSASPQNFTWINGSSHTISVSSPQGSSGTRSVFTTWSDGGGQTHTITAGATLAYTANFKTQYLLTTAVTPVNSGSITAVPTSADGYYDAGTSVQLTATPSSSFRIWSGDLSGSINPQSVVMSASRSVTATFGITTTVTTSPSGLQITVDGVALTAPQSFSWATGSSHTIGVGSPQGTGTARVVFTGWSDGGPQSHTIAAGSTSAYTASFKTQYLLTSGVSPAGLGTVSAVPTSTDGFYDAGTGVQLIAAPSTSFQGWTGDVSGSTNPQSLVMNTPHAVTAVFGTPLLPPITFPLPSTVTATQQQPVQLGLASPYPLQITGQLSIRFTPNAVNNAVDPNVMFTTGGTTANFTVPQGSLLAQFSLPNTMIQTGTVAGTITITAHFQLGGIDITPSPAPTYQMTVNQAAPSLSDSVQVVKSTSGFTVEVTGYSTTRELRQAIFRFTAASNGNLQTIELTVDLTAAATSWYQSPDSVAVGSAFHYAQPFTVDGNVSDISSVTVTLVNTQGNSETRSGAF